MLTAAKLIERLAIYQRALRLPISQIFSEQSYQKRAGVLKYVEVSLQCSPV